MLLSFYAKQRMAAVDREPFMTDWRSRRHHHSNHDRSFLHFFRAN